MNVPSSSECSISCTKVSLWYSIPCALFVLCAVAAVLDPIRPLPKALARALVPSPPPSHTGAIPQPWSGGQGLHRRLAGGVGFDSGQPSSLIPPLRCTPSPVAPDPQCPVVAPPEDHLHRLSRSNLGVPREVPQRTVAAKRGVARLGLGLHATVCRCLSVGNSLFRLKQALLPANRRPGPGSDLSLLSLSPPPRFQHRSPSVLWAPSLSILPTIYPHHSSAVRWRPHRVLDSIHPVAATGPDLPSSRP